MKLIKLKDKKRLNKLIQQYTKLVSTNTYKGQYALVKQIKPLVKRIQVQTNECLYCIEQNERTRRIGIKRKDWNKTTDTIGKYSVKKIRDPHKTRGKKNGTNKD